MREIKFRAWDGSQMLTEENFDFVVSDYNSIIRLDEYGWTEHWVDCVEQYTGLKDKNGKEIYEGDIVEIDKYGKFQIIWYERACRFDFDKIGKREREEPLLSQGWGQKTEVIGNIHENPELLKEDE